MVEAAARRLPVYAALSYDGRVDFDPADPFDAEIVAAVNRHQRGNKGFGPALGPTAAAKAAQAFERVGYSFVDGPSDWAFGPDDRDIQDNVLKGFAQAVLELQEVPANVVSDWCDRRSKLVAAGRSAMRVGHVDFFALPLPIR